MKTCPFCGGVAKLNGSGYEYYSPCWVKCTQCGAEGPTRLSEEEAEKGWNERAQEDKWISVKGKWNCIPELCSNALNLLKEQEAEIKRLEKELAVTQDNLLYYVNGKD